MLHPSIVELMSSVFSKIIAGELPGRFVYRDDSVVAFLTIEPFTPGHTLVVPVEEVDKWTDLSPELWTHLNEVAQKVGRAVMDVTGTERAAYMIAGFEVPHTHIHVFGANGMDEITAPPMPSLDDAAMDDLAARLAEALG